MEISRFLSYDETLEKSSGTTVKYLKFRGLQVCIKNRLVQVKSIAILPKQKW
jgi:hypothetical protein